MNLILSLKFHRNLHFAFCRILLTYLFAKGSCFSKIDEYGIVIKISHIFIHAEMGVNSYENKLEEKWLEIPSQYGFSVAPP